jgi:2-desacetyl-2-hydroxyethyl bacteriochlorophyllide A dehydrogenase
MQTTAILFTDIEQVTLAPVEIPEPAAGEVLLEALYTVISPGTELRCRAGQQEGARFPLIPGYSFVGRVIDRGSAATLASGTLVYGKGTARASENLTWGGHIQHAVQAEQDVLPLPPDLPPLWGAVTRVVAIAYRGVRLSRPAAHETVAVIGQGTIGALSARLHAISGARVVVFDLSPARIAIAEAAGLEAVLVEGDLAATIQAILPDGADIVVDATGAPAVLPQALAAAKPKPFNDSVAPGARFIIQGSYPDTFSIPYTAAFMKELTFHLPRDVQPRDLRAALDLMARGKLDLTNIISDVRTPEAAADTYAELASPDTELITVAFEWQKPVA